MKKFITKVLGTVSIIVLFLALVPAMAQYTKTVMHTGGLYAALAKDASGNIYVTKAASAGVYHVVKYTNGTGSPTTIYSGLTSNVAELPWGLAVAPNGDVYISTDFTSNAGAIIRLNAASAYAATTVQTGSYFTGLTFDATGNLYTLEYNATNSDYAVCKYTNPSGVNSAKTMLYHGLPSDQGVGYPTGITISPSGDIYVTKPYTVSAVVGVPTYTGGILKINAPTYATTTSIATGTYTTSLTLDEFGNLYASESSGGNNYSLNKYAGATGTPTAFYATLHASGTFYPYGVAFIGTTGYVADGDDGTTGGELIKLAPTDVTLPTVPTGLAASAGSSQNTLTWNTNADVDLLGYKVYGGTSAAPTTLLASISKGTTTYTHTGLINGTPYFYRISAEDNYFNESAKTADVTATPTPPAITSATYNASTGALVVTGSAFPALAGATNDIVTSKFTLTGEGGATYALTSPDVEITSSTAFTINLNAADKNAVGMMLNKNGTSSTGGTTYNLAAAEDWAAGENPASVIVDTTNPITVSNVAAPAITSATYNVSTGALVVTGTGFLKLNGATNDIVANKFALTGEGGSTYTLTNTGNVEITSGTAFTLTLSATDQAAVNQIVNKNGTLSTGGTTYNLAGAEDWAAGADPAVVVADLTGNGITASNVAVPAITSATYNASTGALVVTGTNFLSLSGATNDIVANKFTFIGEGGSSYTLTNTPNAEITSGTAFTLALSATDQAGANQIINKNGTSSTSGTTYNLAAAEDWAAGADVAVVVADLTGNGITASNVAVPTLVSATYNASSGVLVVTGTGFLKLSGATNDIVANKFTLTGEGGSTYTLTNTPNVEITSATAFSLTLSATDKTAVNLLANKNGTSSTGGTTYNLAGAEDWAAGADAAVVVADLTANGITVSNVAVPAITSATYNASTGALVVTGTNLLPLSGPANDITANKISITAEGGSSYTLTNTADVDITSTTTFTLTLSAEDKAALNLIVNKDGTSSTGGTTYNLAAAEDWAAGADAAVVVADLTGNGITASNVAAPTITAATYDATTGILAVTGTGFLKLNGATNDIVASKLTFKGQGAATYTLTDSPNTEITSGTAFSITLSATDKGALALLMNKDGLTAADATVYNLAAAEDWNAGAAVAVVIADAISPVTVSGAKSRNADLATLTTNAGTFTPTFAAGTTSYRINVPYTTASATITATRAESHATLASSLGAGGFTALTDGAASGAYTLADGANAINVKVTAEETTVTKTYTITVNKQVAASVGDFVWLDYNQNGVQDGGEPGVVGATVTLTGTDIFANAVNLTTTTNASGNYTFSNLNPSSAYNVVVSGYPARYTATYDLDGVGTAGATFALASGQNRTDVDFGLYDPYYANADLSALSTTAGLTPVFAAGTIGYSASVLTATSSVKLTATALAAGSTLQINSNGAGFVALTSGVETADLALNFGNNTFDVKVTAQNGTTTKTYTVTVNRPNASQSITFATTASTTYGAADFDPGATSATSAINAITYSSSNLSVATIVAGKIHVVGAGTAVITAKQAASTGYNAATDATQTLTVNGKDLTGNFTAGNKVYDGNTTSTILTRTLTGVLPADVADVTLTGGTATFANADAANGKTVTSTGMTLGGLKAGNYTLSTVNTTTANITAKDITASFSAANKAYDGTNTATISTRTLTGVLAGDIANVSATGGVATFNNESAGTGKTVTATGITLTGTKATNYNLTTIATTTADITGIALTGTFTADNKVYDGNTTATVLTRNLTGVLPADAADVTLTGGTATFATADVANAKTVTAAGMTLGGTKAGNYTLSSVSTTTANVTKLDITGTITASNKSYDGTTTATLSGRSLVGVLAGDVANVTATGGTATFGTADVAIGKTVTSTGITLTGTKSGNYNLTSVATTIANITAKDITGTFTADNKVYDGNTTATVLTRGLTGVLAGDVADVTLTGGTATFANATVGAGKTVTSTGMTLGGTKEGNYNLTSVATTTANITGFALTGNFTVANKAYDGTNSATILTRTLTGVLAADVADVTLTGGTATFGGINTGTGKTVTSTGMVLSGAKAANYTLFAVNTTTADITPKDINGGFTAANKAYDGTTSASILTRSLTGVLAADVADVTVSGGTATFANENVGTGKTVNASGMVLGGTQAANYNLNTIVATTANITAKDITGSFTASNKVYDGNTTATVLTRSLTGVVAADVADVNLTGGAATFANASAGTGKTVTAAGMTLSGARAGNYNLTGVATTTADITGFNLTGNFTAANKVYDGTNSATILTRTLTGVLAADLADVTLTGGTATFGGINTGTGKTVTSTGMVLSGAKAGNYTLFAVNTATADITAKDISGTFTASNKVYDGNATATVLTRNLTGVLASDVADVTLTGGTATFANANIGTGKTVTAAGMTLGGTKADNYNLTGVATTTANITGLALTGNFTADNKVYDGNANASILTRTLTGVLAADVADVTLTGGTATFANADAGTGKTVTSAGMVLSGAKAGNYTLSTVNTTTANISVKDISGTFTADNKVYDGNANANILTRSLTGVIAADVANVTLTGGTATFANANTGIGKTVTAAGMTLGGTKASNYNLTGVATTTANITAMDISGSFTASNKVYDGNANATVLTRNLTGVLAADVADITLTGGTATFANANIGTGKTVTAAGMTLGGTKATNYNLTGVATTTANITGLALTGNFTADSKVYDGNTTAVVLTRTLTGVLAADVADVTLNGGTATFADANAGTGKTVTSAGMVLSGAKAANYTLSAVNTTTANITTKAIGGIFTADNKVYDGNTNASILTRSLTGVLAADVANVNLIGGTATFADANIGTGKTVTATAMALTGTKAANYNLTGVATTTANITGLALTGNFTADSKVYDGNTTAVVLTRTLTGVLAADVADVSLTGGTATFADANAGTGKTVTSAGMVLSGAKAANYTLSAVNTTTANIITKGVSGSFTASNKVYDGNTTATILTGSLTGVLAADLANVSLTGGTAAFANANVGAAKVVTATGSGLTGTKAANYNLTGVSTTTADITAKNITGTFTADNKAYDGNTTASILTRSLTGVLTVDIANVTLIGGTAVFADANVGSSKTVTSTGMTLSGSQAANYNLTSVATTTANIGVKTLVGTFTADNKVYDGNTTATVLTRSLTGVLTADVANVTLTGGTAAFADANAGTGKTVTAAGMALTGTKAANYSLTSVSNTTANITAKVISGSFTADNKIYDGTTIANILTRTLTGVLTGDVANVTLTGGTGAFADKNIGTAKTVTASGMALTGTSATNYSLSAVATTTANISAKPIVVTADAKTKVYGSADPALTYTLSAGALATGDAITGSLNRAVGENIGNYAIAQNTISAGTNYIITYTPADLVVTRKALVITADNKNKNYGDANPTLTASYSGFVGTETVAVLTSPVVLSTTATLTSTAGNYPITASGAAAANYSISYVAGTLTVNKTAQTITFAALANKLSTDGVFTLTATASSGLAVTYTSSNSAVARIINGNQVEILRAGVINITANQVGDANYLAATGVVQPFTVIDNPPPVISITSSKGNSISKGERAVLTATGAVTYQWSNANGIISGQNTAALTVRPSQTTTYTVTGFNQYGRSSTQSFTLEVRADYQVLNIMNVLTPNGDGKNDTWVVENIDMYPNNTVRIFDRAGKSIFEMKGYDNSWGGTLKGALVPEGAYYYIIDFGPGIGVRKGYITIVGNN